MRELVEVLRSSTRVEPFGLHDVVLPIELEGPVDLFAVEIERIAHGHGLAIK
ncbi:hypothetical protein D3C72_2005870 [compost metagenome]